MNSVLQRRLRMMRGGGVSPYLLRDTFTDADGTNLNGRAVEEGSATPATWTVNNGAYNIQSNRANQTGTVDPTMATADAGQANAATSVVGNLAGQHNGIGSLLRFSDNSNHWLADLNPVGFQLFEVNGGGYTSRASSAGSFPASADHTIAATCNGTSFTASVNGGNGINYTSSFGQANTRFGIKTSKSGQRMDDFQVTA